MKLINNPFVIGKYVSPDYFCDRESESLTLKHHIRNERNVVLMSERRIGKTGLIEHCMNSPEWADNYYCFFIDIYAAHNLKEMVVELANSVCTTLNARQKGFLDRVGNLLRSIQATISYDSVSGMPQMSFSLGQVDHPEKTLDEILSLLETADRPCIVAVDEFQQIAEFDEDNMEALLRTKIQHLKNVQFIFAGSKRHLLDGIFNSPQRPFYNSVVFMQLSPIALEAYSAFARRLFANAGRTIDPELIGLVYRNFDGITWYLQLFMNEAFACTEQGGIISVDCYDVILQHLIDTKRFTFEERYAQLTEPQKAVLKALAREFPYTPNMLSKEFLTRHSLKTASRVQSAVKSLVNNGIVSQSGTHRQISDYLFAYWLKQ